MLFFSMLMKYRNIAIFLCCLCFGCSQRNPEVKIEKEINKVILRRTLEWMGKEEIDDICRRIKNLDITFVAPGAGITEGSYYVMLGLIKKYGISIPKAAMENKAIFYCSDSEIERLKHFEEAIASKQNILWAIRGGFGSNMIIAGLNRRLIPQKKKTLIGFSDTTSLNIFVTQKWGWRAIHAPVFVHMEKKMFSSAKFNTLLDILEGKIDSYEIQDVYPINSLAQKTTSLSGALTGGNLTIIEAGFGTPWEIDTDNKIIFIEDINLSAWRIFRSVYHLQESGKLKNARAIVFGKFVKCGSQKEIGMFLSKVAQSLDIPVYITDQFGHGNYNKPLVYNAIATLRDNKMIIDLKENAQRVGAFSKTESFKEERQKKNHKKGLKKNHKKAKKELLKDDLKELLKEDLQKNPEELEKEYSKALQQEKLEEDRKESAKESAQEDIKEFLKKDQKDGFTKEELKEDLNEDLKKLLKADSRNIVEKAAKKIAKDDFKDNLKEFLLKENLDDGFLKELFLKKD